MRIELHAKARFTLDRVDGRPRRRSRSILYLDGEPRPLRISVFRNPVVAARGRRYRWIQDVLQRGWTRYVRRLSCRRRRWSWRLRSNM